MRPLRIRLGHCAVLTALALAGCAEVGPNFTTPHGREGAGYLGRGDRTSSTPRIFAADSPAGAWWSALGSPDLDTTIKLALDDSPTLSEADATLAQARQSLNAARGARLPQIDANAGAQRERINTAAFGFSGFPSPTISLYSIGAAVTYDLDLFGGQKRRVEAASARLDAQTRRAEAAYLSLTGNVALEAVQVAGLRAQIGVIAEVAAEDRRTLSLAETAARLGGASRTGTIGAQAQLAQDEALLPALNQSLAQHRHALALLVGKSPAEFSPPDFDLKAFSEPSEIPVSLPSQLIRRRPDILAAEADLHAATADVGVATAELYPDIRLSANLTQSALRPQDIFKFRSTGYAIGPALSVPLFHGGALRANQRAAAAGIEASWARYQQTVLKAFTEVADALAALANDQDAISAETRALRVAQSNLEAYRIDYKEGGGTLLQVVDAERTLSIARRGLAVARAQQLSDTIRLYVATAADWRTPDARSGPKAP